MLNLTGFGAENITFLTQLLNLSFIIVGILVLPKIVVFFTNTI